MIKLLLMRCSLDWDLRSRVMVIKCPVGFMDLGGRLVGTPIPPSWGRG